MAPLQSTLRRALLPILAVVVCLAPLAANAQPDTKPVTVFAASSLKNAMDEVLAAFAARTHVAARASYGGSPAIARQIEQGAPADLFISADPDWMYYLARKDLILPSSRVDLLSNHLALIAPAGATSSIRITKGMRLAAALGKDRLAIASPEVPAGRYAEAALTALGVWPALRDRLARAENVRAALGFVARGETPFGIVYDTDAKVEPRVRIVGLFPDSTHPPIRYPVAIVAASRNSNARALLAFLTGQEAGAIFRRYQFRTLPSQ